MAVLLSHSQAKSDSQQFCVCSQNSQCRNAIPITPTTSGITRSGTTLGAPSAASRFAACGVSMDQAGSVFYKFTSPGGHVKVSTCNRVDFDTKLSVFHGQCSNLQCMCGNDDASALTNNSGAIVPYSGNGNNSQDRNRGGTNGNSIGCRSAPS